MMKHIILIFFSIFITTTTVYAQYDLDGVDESVDSENARFDWAGVKKNLYVGGDVNAFIGNGAFIYFAPFIGYEFIPSLSAGISGMLRYQSQPYNGGVIGKFSKGTGVFVRFKPQIPLIVETSFNFYSSSFKGIIQDTEVTNSWMLGVGYAQSMGERSYTQIMIQYDLLKKDNVPENLLLQFPGGGRLYYKFGIVYYLD